MSLCAFGQLGQFVESCNRLIILKVTMSLCVFWFLRPVGLVAQHQDMILLYLDQPRTQCLYQHLYMTQCHKQGHVYIQGTANRLVKTVVIDVLAAIGRLGVELSKKESNASIIKGDRHGAEIADACYLTYCLPIYQPECHSIQPSSDSLASLRKDLVAFSQGTRK